jgi:sugar lactone lactonase YvrE
VPADGGRVPLFLVDPEGKVRIVAEDLKIPNGIVYDAETHTLLVAETMGFRIIAFDLLDDGSLGPGRTYGDIGPRSPDGIALDSQGRLWVASPFSSEFIRLGRDGVIDTVVQVPGGAWAVACAVGESDDELWCAVVDTTIEDYQQGRSKGSVKLWRGA